MKLIYSELKKLLPSLEVPPQQLRDDLTMIGHFTNFYEEIEDEIVFDLDIKINRGDCLGYYGIARDLSVYYKIDLVLPQTNNTFDQSQPVLPIQVTTPDVIRIMALKISDIKVGPSPDWLIKFLKLHNINSVNNIVDFSNYIMFLYSIPNHAFDAIITSDNLIWENNNGKNNKFTTLDGTILNLSSNNLVISNPQEVISTDLVGGKNSGINTNTTETIIEVAVYNRVRIRLDSRDLKTVTEASIRLEKDLDPDTIPLAINHLTWLITNQARGQISSQIYDYYPRPLSPPQISFNFDLPTKISGINIPKEFSLQVLEKLGCTINGNLITPPSIRPDITMEEDLVEEVVRFYGYNHIPIDQPINFKEVTDITPKEIYLIDQLKDQLVALGYDEVLTWPLVSQPVDPATVITTQNSINTESIYLRQSLIPSLEQQLDQYQRFKVPSPQFFEIGKIFYQQDGKYLEKNSLGVYNHNSTKLQNDLQELNLSTQLVDKNFIEIILDNLPKIDSYTPKTINNSAIELTSQIITLDANVNFNSPQDPQQLIEKYSSLIDRNILWSMEITDIFENKYTFRVSYYNVDDKTAKKIHLTTFDLL